MKAPIKKIPPELNRRLDELERDTKVNIDEIITRVLERIVIPPATQTGTGLPDGLNEQFLIYKAELEGWIASYINDFRVRGILFVNSDYSSGDEDAIIYFNGTSKSLKYDEGAMEFQIDDDMSSIGGSFTGDIIIARTDMYVNSDYVSGDEDATIYFLYNNHYLKFDYGNDQFEMDKNLVANSVSLADHNARHESGGADEVDIGALGAAYVCHDNAVVCHNNNIVYI